MLAGRALPIDGHRLLYAMLALLFVCHVLSARTADPDLRNVPVEGGVFSANEVAALNRGEPVVKGIRSNDPRDIITVWRDNNSVGP
jgi:hypothetical protein